MDQNVVRISESTTLNEVLKKMVESGAWSVLVERQHLPVGIATERDIIRRAIVKGFDLNKTKAGEIMSSPLITVGPDASVGEAMQLLAEKDIRRLFVLEEGKIIGRVTQTGLFHNSLNIMLSILSTRSQI
jgi:CBS domain-containing protein